VPNDLRKRVFSKAIENINKCFLRSTDEYLDRTYLDQLPQAEIESTFLMIQYASTHSHTLNISPVDLKDPIKNSTNSEN
jgi:hypothetical protein